MLDNINLEKRVSLAPMTTMGVGGNANYLVRIKNENDLQSIVDWAVEQQQALLILGEGSNMIVSDSGWDGVVLKMENKGIEILHTSLEHVEIRVQAGVDWDDLVAYTVENGWWGVENMSLIPGTVGACPVQNVGAYGQECKKVITSVKVYDTLNQEWRVLTNSDCRFSFRTSIFNTTEKGRYIITAVNFKLSTLPSPCLTRSAVRNLLRKKRREKNDQAAIREAVIELRTSGKLLPKPDTLGSSGTFFRASLVPRNLVFRLILTTWKNLGVKTACKLLACVIKYNTRAGTKVPSRLLIEACRLTGVKVRSAELFSLNPAVIATHATPPPETADILTLIQLVRSTVYAKTGLEVPVEPTLVGFSDDDLKDIFSLPHSN
jgi:UDP-N-acetylmuramate dehydrogenase